MYCFNTCILRTILTMKFKDLQCKFTLERINKYIINKGEKVLHTSISEVHSSGLAIKTAETGTDVVFDSTCFNGTSWKS